MGDKRSGLGADGLRGDGSPDHTAAEVGESAQGGLGVRHGGVAPLRLTRLALTGGAELDPFKDW